MNTITTGGRWCGSVLLAICLLTGCSTWQARSLNEFALFKEDSPPEPEAIYAKAIGHYQAGEIEKAEKLLGECLQLQPGFGLAHNALGKIKFDRRQYYYAAWEFEHAAESLPGRPEPINNLGLVYEEAGRLDLAVQQFEEASSLAPDSPEYLGNLLRARLRRGDSSAELADQMRRLIDLDSRPEWRAWARQNLNTGRLSRFANPSVTPITEEIPSKSNESDDGRSGNRPVWENLQDQAEELTLPVERLPRLPIDQ